MLISNRLAPLSPVTPKAKAEIGRVLALGVSGFTGVVLEIEALAFRAAVPGRGSIRFNEAAGSMARFSFCGCIPAAKISGVDLNDYTLHLNVVGGVHRRPSAGAASSWPYTVVNELPCGRIVLLLEKYHCGGSFLKPVGGITEKIYGARPSGLRKVVVPAENRSRSEQPLS